MMNERIQELKHQAFLWCDENIPEQYSHETGYGDAWEDKFAELLIRECIEQCKKQEYEYWRAPEDQEFTPQDCADAIARHFGVEE